MMADVRTRPPRDPPGQALNEGSEMEPNDIDLVQAKAERVAFATSQEPGRTNWTELAVYYLHQPPHTKRRWLSESIGRTVVEGQRDRVRRLNVGSLERALKLFTDTDMGVVVSEQARDWAEEQTLISDEEAKRRGVAMIRYVDMSKPGAFDDLLNNDGITPAEPSADELTDDAGALAWLYGKPDGGKATFASMLARDFDLAPTTVTTALRSSTPIRIPLRQALRFFDRAAFRAWRASREKNDG